MALPPHDGGGGGIRYLLFMIIFTGTILFVLLPRPALSSAAVTFSYMHTGLLLVGRSSVLLGTCKMSAARFHLGSFSSIMIIKQFF